MKTNPTALMRRAGAGVSAGALVTASLLLIASPAHAANKTITSNLVDQSETRSTGHNVFGADGVHVYTESNTSTDKAAGYFDAHGSLADAGEPSMSWSPTPGHTNTVKPSVQLKVDFDNDGSIDGILVGEPTYADGSNLYGNDWWLSNGSKQAIKDNAPSHAGGSGSSNHGTLDAWRSAYPDAEIIQSGWSLGSGVKGDGTINSITVGGDKYFFTKSADAEDVTLYANDVDQTGTRVKGHNDFRPTSGVNVHTDAIEPDFPGDAGHFPGYVNSARGMFPINQPLTGLGEPTMDFRQISGSIPPGLWINLDIDGDGAADGTLIKETAYGNDWWLNDTDGPLAQYAPTVGGGSGSDHHGGLAEWRGTLPAGTKVVTAGWSLGSGVTGSYIVDHITVGQKRFSFGNRAPVANDVTGSVSEHGTTTFQADASDPDGDALTYSISGEAGDASIDSNGVISYDPDGTTGSDSFTYTVTDAAGVTATADVDVTINANSAPVLPRVKGSVKAGASVVVTLAGTDSDGDALTYSIPASVDNGTAVLSGDQVTFTAVNDFHGGTTFEYSATDGYGGSATGTVKINVGRANSHVSFTTSPDPLKSSSTVVVHVTVTSTGSVYRGRADVYDGTKLVGTGLIHSYGTRDITLSKKLTKGTHTLRVKYRGTTYTNAKSHSMQVTVI